MAKEAIGSLNKSFDDSQEMKKALQNIIMDECSDLFQLYDFRLVKLVAERDNFGDGYTFTVGVMSPRVQNGNTLYVSHSITRTDVFRSSGSFSFAGSPSMACSNVVIQLFHQLSRRLRQEVEKLTREMPVVANNPFSVYQSNSITYNSATIMAQMPQQQVRINPEDITSFSNPVKKVSQFEHIDSLIGDAKKRLGGGYAKPVLAFQYF